MSKIFFVCSYGGCGSKMLCTALKPFGQVYHVHSRIPPDNLQYIGDEMGGNSYIEWFNGINIPDNEIKNYYVIYIYKNPVKSIMSRFCIPEHLRHIQLDTDIKLDDVLNTGTDLYKIREFYDNYTQSNEKRNYKIYSVKYEEIFDKQHELSKILGIGDLNLVKRETERTHPEKLNEIYKELIDIMNKNNFIIIN
jgi:hypothetical protein